jgi:hypothetical protein
MGLYSDTLLNILSFNVHENGKYFENFSGPLLHPLAVKAVNTIVIITSLE